MAAPASLGIAIAALPVERRATAVTIWSSTLALSSAVGPVIGGFVIELSSWRWAFALNIPIGVVALIWGARVLPDSIRDPSARRPDLIGHGLNRGGAAAYDAQSGMHLQERPRQQIGIMSLKDHKKSVWQWFYGSNPSRWRPRALRANIARGPRLQGPSPPCSWRSVMVC